MRIENLKPPSDPSPRSWEQPLLEWAGLFLFAVGAYGTLYRGVTRHLAVWGILPLDWLYSALLIGGALLMLWGSPWSPFHPAQTTSKSFWGRALLFVRQAFTLFLLAVLFGVALFG